MALAAAAVMEVAVVAAMEQAVGMRSWMVVIETTDESAAPAVARTAFAWWPDLEEDAAVSQ